MISATHTSAPFFCATGKGGGDPERTVEAVLARGGQGLAVEDVGGEGEQPRVAPELREEGLLLAAVGDQVAGHQLGRGGLDRLPLPLLAEVRARAEGVVGSAGYADAGAAAVERVLAGAVRLPVRPQLRRDLLGVLGADAVDVGQQAVEGRGDPRDVVGAEELADDAVPPLREHRRGGGPRLGRLHHRGQSEGVGWRGGRGSASGSRSNIQH